MTVKGVPNQYLNNRSNVHYLYIMCIRKVFVFKLLVFFVESARRVPSVSTSSHHSFIDGCVATAQPTEIDQDNKFVDV